MIFCQSTLTRMILVLATTASLPVPAQTLSTTVGAIRAAYANHTLLAGDDSHPERKYRVLDKIECNMDGLDAMPIQAKNIAGEAGYILRFGYYSAGLTKPGEGSSIQLDYCQLRMFSGTLMQLTAEETDAADSKIKGAEKPASTAEAKAALPETKAGAVEPSASISPGQTAPGSGGKTGKLGAYHVAPLTDRPATAAAKDFYSFEEPKSGLYIGIERLTDKAAEFWQQRLALEAYTYLNSYVQEAEKKHREPSLMASARPTQFALTSGEETGLGPDRHLEAQEMMHGWEKAFTPELEQLSRTHSSPHPSYIEDYLGAWRGFRYNLKHPANVTWVAYLTTSPVTGFQYLEPANVASTAIKMAMTVQITDGIYCPLGIFTSPIGYFGDLGSKVKRGSKSMLLHAGVAKLVNEINPGKMDLAVIRPLASMRAILAKSSIPYAESTASTAYFEGINRNCITDAGLFNADTIAALGYSGEELVLIEPGPEKMHFIAPTHWFATSPFLGGMHRDWKNMGQFPYVIIKRADLAAALERADSAESDKTRERKESKQEKH